MSERKYKWHENITLGILYSAISFVTMFNGFTKLTSLFVKDGKIEGGVTKEKGIIALFSKIESSWWKYLVIAAFSLLAYNAFKTGISKYKNGKK